MDRSIDSFLNSLSEIAGAESEILLWARAAAFCNYGSLACERDRTRVLAFALAAGEYCLRNGHPLETYHELLRLADTPRPE